MPLFKRSKTILLVLLSGLLVFIAGLSIQAWWKRVMGYEPPEPVAEDDALPPVEVLPASNISLSGLTEAEAESRTPDIDMDALRKRERRKFLGQAIRKNLFTLFNFDLIGITVMLYFLGSPLGALGSLLVLVIAVTLNTLQETYTKNKLDQMLQNIQPQANVIRDGHIKSIDRWLVVRDDLLIVRRGDQILVNGVIASGDSLTVEERRGSDEKLQRIQKQVGDRLIEGSYCIDGYAIYQAQESGAKYLESESEAKIKLFHEAPTPLQRMMRVVFLGLLGLVVLFSIYLLVDGLMQGAQIVSAEYRDGLSIIFAVGPTSLFLVLVVQYAMGTVRFMDYRALIYESNKIEALSNVSTVCFAEESLYSQLQVNIEPISNQAGEHQFSGSLIRHLLGDIVHSIPLYSPHGHTLAESLPGAEHQPLETVPLLSTIGWYGVTFDETDLRGTFILGQPEVLQDALLKEDVTITEKVGSSLSEAQHGLGRWLRKVTRRGENETYPSEAQADTVLEDAIVDAEEDADRQSLWRDHLVPSLLGLMEAVEERENILEKGIWQGERSYIFAYLPDPVVLIDQDNVPRLPRDLIPLSYILISDAVRLELGQVLQDLADDGADIKVLSSATPERAIATARKLGLEDDLIKPTTYNELKTLTSEAFSQALHGANVFGDLTPSQKADIVKTLRLRGEYVAMVGADIDDVPAMREAQISVALRSGNAAVLKQTDIVLLEDSLQVLPRLFFLGQRMVNGAVGTFQLFLSQVGAQLLILIYMLLFNLEHFPYHPTQGGVVNAFAIVIPNILLPVWAAGGRSTMVTIRRRMIHFIIPIAFLLSILGVSVYWLFLGLDFGSNYPPAELVKQLEITDPQRFYARQAVVYAFLFAGWLRVFFLQPPTKFWVGGAPLRGDRRVVGLVLSSILAFILILVFPWLPLQEWLRITWLPSLRDYLIIAGMVAVWAIVLRTLWRFILRFTKHMDGFKDW